MSTNWFNFAEQPLERIRNSAYYFTIISEFYRSDGCLLQWQQPWQETWRRFIGSQANAVTLLFFPSSSQELFSAGWQEEMSLPSERNKSKTGTGGEQSVGGPRRRSWRSMCRIVRIHCTVLKLCGLRGFPVLLLMCEIWWRIGQWQFTMASVYSMLTVGYLQFVHSDTTHA